MPSVPSVKGSVLVGVAESVNKLLVQGTISREELTRWLKPEDIALINQEMLVSEWYDVRALARMSELLRDVQGKGDNEYLRQLGRQSARRLLDSGLYQQLEYLQALQVTKASDQKSRFEAFGRDLRLLTTLTGSIFSFTKWESRPDPEQEGRYIIRISDARDFSDVLCWRSDGFINEMAKEHNEPDLWRWERAARDLVLFRMNRAV